MTTSVISNTDKVPGAYKQYVFNTGPNGTGIAPFILLLVGMKTSDGTAGVETEIVDINDDTLTKTKFGQKSQLRRMASNVYPLGIQCQAIAVAEPSGGVAASAVITLTGTPTGAGTYTIYLAGEQAPISANITTTDTLTTAAAKLVAAINAVDDLPFTATNSAGVVTITCTQKGTYGNQFRLFQDVSAMAPGITATVTGTAGNGGAYMFSGGTGTESVANVIAAITGQKFRRIVGGQVDPTNLALWKTYIDAQQAPIQNNPSHFTAACSDTSTVVTGLSMTTLNDPRFAIVYHPASETHPSEIAASIGAIRTLEGQNYPCFNYDGYVVNGVAPQRSPLDQLQHSQLQTLLDSGVMPLQTTPDGEVVIVRAIVTRCLNGTAPDWRCLDFADAEVPDVVGDELTDKWETDFRPGNPVIMDDPPDPSLPIPSGIGTPSMWNRDCIGVLNALARGDGFPGPVLDSNAVAADPPVSSWNPTAKCIGTTVDCVAAAGNHRVDLLIRQRSAA